MKSVQTWSMKWDLPLNISKCHILTETDEPLSITETNISYNLKAVKKIRDLGVTVSADFKTTLQCQAAAQKARGELFRLRRALTNRTPEVFLPLYSAFVRPHLEYCVQAWSPYLRKDVQCLEKVQRLATRMISGCKGLSYDERLKKLDLFSLERRRVRGDLIEVFKIFKGISGLSVKDFFVTFDTGKVTRGHSMKVNKQFARLNIRANFFSHRVVNKWNKLPQEVVDSDTVKAFKVRLDRIWESL
jgi:ribonuclease P/MRP protein subunit RPP40